MTFKFVKPNYVCIIDKKINFKLKDFLCLNINLIELCNFSIYLIGDKVIIYIFQINLTV